MSKEKAMAVWGSSPAGSVYGEGAEPGTKSFFENVIKKRSVYEMPWLYEIVPFNSFKNKDVLEIGCGAGYDAYEMCRNCANYVGIDITPENVQRTIKHLNIFGYEPVIMMGDAGNLQFEKEKFDIVFSNGVLHHTSNIMNCYNEAYRVLRDKGELWVVLYNKNSLFYRISLYLVEHIINGGFRRMEFATRLSMIEYTTSNVLPIVNVYSKNEIREMLQTAGFKVKKQWVRKMVKEDLPCIKFIWRLWKYIPQRWLDFLGKLWGWYVITYAVKE